MLSAVLFQSDSYAEIQWKALFDGAGVKASEMKQPMGLVNADGLVMVSDCIYSAERVGLCFENDTVQVLHNHLDIVPFSLTHDAGMLFFRLAFENISSTVSNLYVKFINQLVREIYAACLRMFIYTYEHLSNRQYDYQPISKIETVQFQFSDIYCLFQSVESFLLNRNEKETTQYIISVLINILNKITKLGGARSVLKNNALDLLFHLKLFQRFIASQTKE